MRIDDMKPGPELDKVVAQLFGWEYFETKLGIVVKKPNGETCHAHFSTEWEGMRLVVEEMQRRGYAVAIQSGDKEWSVMFYGGITRLHYDTDGDSAPHATVLAAIKALQGEDKS